MRQSVAPYPGLFTTAPTPIPFISRQGFTRPLNEGSSPLPPRIKLGKALLRAGLVTRRQLARVLLQHRRTGVRVGRILVNLGFVTEADLMRLLASQLRLPYFDLLPFHVSRALARLLPPSFEHERRVLPIVQRRDHEPGQEAAVFVVTSDPTRPGLVQELEDLLRHPVQLVVVTESALDAALEWAHRADYLRRASAFLSTRSPEDSAHHVLNLQQKVGLGLTAVALCAGLVRFPLPMLTFLVLLATGLYLALLGYKIYLAYKALRHTLEIQVTPAELAALAERDLPVYTLLVPVYHEKALFPTIVRALEALDYPKEKLDIRILLEQDDEETIAVAEATPLPSHFTRVIVPKGVPRGKPRACNYGLIHARGEFTVIFDAEDIPERDQLKKAVLAFRKGGEHLACIQAKLNYFNRAQNMLTRWFTAEYSMWFDLFLPGLDATSSPIPLGGTSNHFRTDQLRMMGAWDPFNVTEDADLGIRLYKLGWKTAVIDSSTFEEANSHVYNWIRQRSRWIKGYIQTYLVHMRHPVELCRTMGFGAFFSFQCMVGGTFAILLLNPLFWIVTVLWFLTKANVIEDLFPAPVFYAGMFALLWGNFVFLYLNMTGAVHRGYDEMVKYVLLTPIYWVLMSVAAWKGLLQLLYAPSYWEKTVHGLAPSVDTALFEPATTRPEQALKGVL